MATYDVRDLDTRDALLITYAREPWRRQELADDVRAGLGGADHALRMIVLAAMDAMGGRWATVPAVVAAYDPDLRTALGWILSSMLDLGVSGDYFAGFYAAQDAPVACPIGVGA